MKRKNYTHNLGFQIVRNIFFLVTFVCIALALLLFTFFKRYDEKVITENMSKRAGDIGKLIDYEINSYIQHVEDIAQRDEIRSMDFSQQKPVLISEAKRIGFERFQVGNLKGDVISTTGEKANAADRPFYKQALAGKSNISDVLFARIDKKMVIVVSSPIYDHNGKIIGVLSGVTAAKKMNEILSSIKLDFEGSTFIINKSGQKMAGIDYSNTQKLDNDLEKQNNTAVASMASAEKAMIAAKNGLTFFSKDNKTYYLTFTTINNGNWILGIYQNRKESLKELSAMLLPTLLIAFCFIIIGILVGFRFKQKLRPLHILGDSVTGIASGNADLTKRIELKSKNEIGTVVSGFNSFAEKLQSIIKELKKSEDTLSSAGKSLNICAEDTSTGITQILENINKVGSKVTDQAAGVEQTAGAVHEIASNIQSLEKMIENQAGEVVEASSAVEEMIGNIESVNQSIEKMTTSFSELEEKAKVGSNKQQDVNERILQIEEESEMLQEANQTIASIAEQTNLLAMNAAIEAAHAGEAGKGFSVVADEIRKLSETSKTQSESIKSQLTKIKESITSVVSASDESSKAFNSVTYGIQQTDELVQQIHNAMEEQSEGSKQINIALHAMNDRTSEVRTASEEMTEGNKSILEAVNNLKTTSLSIKENMNEMSTDAKKINETGNSLTGISEEVENSIESIGNQIGLFKV